jgi:hypothetical protein
MRQMLVTARYRVRGDHAHFRHDMTKTAGLIAGIPGLVWKIWGIDQDRDIGASAYLFASEASARAFIAGPMLERLRSRPDVTDVSFELRPSTRICRRWPARPTRSPAHRSLRHSDNLNAPNALSGLRRGDSANSLTAGCGPIGGLIRRFRLWSGAKAIFAPEPQC